MRAAIVKNDIVINVIEVDDLGFDHGIDGAELISADLVGGDPVAEIGWTKQGEVFAPPVEPAEPPIETP